jgi:hypothetical protein
MGMNQAAEQAGRFFIVTQQTGFDFTFALYWPSGTIPESLN